MGGMGTGPTQTGMGQYGGRKGPGFRESVGRFWQRVTAGMEMEELW